MAMQAAVQGLAALAGALRMLHTIAWGKGRAARWKLGRAALRLHIKVFCGHFVWRFAPAVAAAIPNMLLPPQGDPPSFQDVPLDNPRFQEPGPRGKCERAEREAARLGHGLHRRWADVSLALQDLARWLRLEALQFRRRVLLWDSLGQQVLSPAPAEFKDATAEDVEGGLSDQAIRASVDEDLAAGENADDAEPAVQGDEGDLPLSAGMAALVEERRAILVSQTSADGGDGSKHPPTDPSVVAVVAVDVVVVVGWRWWLWWRWLAVGWDVW